MQSNMLLNLKLFEKLKFEATLIYGYNKQSMRMSIAKNGTAKEEKSPHIISSFFADEVSSGKRFLGSYISANVYFVLKLFASFCGRKVMSEVLEDALKWYFYKNYPDFYELVRDILGDVYDAPLVKIRYGRRIQLYINLLREQLKADTQTTQTSEPILVKKKHHRKDTDEQENVSISQTVDEAPELSFKRILEDNPWVMILSKKRE